MKEDELSSNLEQGKMFLLINIDRLGLIHINFNKYSQLCWEKR
jgi:hypothetical protein